MEVSLSDFAEKVQAKNRITFGDVQRLRRDVLPDGIESREQAEQLLDLDRSIARIEHSWEACLVALFVDFVVWAERPTGIVDEASAEWVSTVLGAPERATRTARLIAREIADEAAGFENDALTSLEAGLAKTSPRETSSDDLSLAEATP
jgi:hypothetical protein